MEARTMQIVQMESFRDDQSDEQKQWVKQTESWVAMELATRIASLEASAASAADPQVAKELRDGAHNLFRMYRSVVWKLQRI